MMLLEQKLTEKINKAKVLDIGDVISESIELFKKVWVQGLLLQVFLLVVAIPLLLMIYVPFIGLIISEQSNLDGFEFLKGFSIAYGLFVFAIIVVLGIAFTAINAGFFRIIKLMDQGARADTSDFWYYFKAGRFKKIATLAFLIIGIVIVAALLCYLPVLYVIVPLSYVLLFYVHYPELETRSILNLSFKLGNKKWGITFGVLILTYLAVTVASFMSCGIGQIFLQSFLHLPAYIIFKHIIGVEKKSDIDKIGEAFVD